MPLIEDRVALHAALKSGARSRKLHAGNDWLGDTTDDLFFYTLNSFQKTYEDDGRLRMFQYVKAKPMAIDSLQWATLSPSSSMGTAAKRIRLRQNGAFAVFGLILKHGDYFYTPGDDPEAWAAQVLDDFEGNAALFRAEHPDPAAFLTAIDRIVSERPDLPWWHSLLRLYTLVAAGDVNAAGALAHAGVAAHQGSFEVGSTTVWEMLARDYDARAGIFAADYRPLIP